MNKRTVFFPLLFICAYAAGQVPKAPSDLKVLGLSEYQHSVQLNPDNALVEIKKAIPNITLNIRYATRNNFMQQVMYKQPRAFARKPVVAQLKRIQQELNKQGLGLKIYDGYRPYAVTVAFYQKATDKAFVANPREGSRHNRGCAVDISIIHLKTGKELVMPTPYDSFSPVAAADYSPLPEVARKNRDLLIATMQRYGFTVIQNEWWHFDFKGWKNFDLLDIPFEKL